MTFKDHNQAKSQDPRENLDKTKIHWFKNKNYHKV